MIIDIVQYIGCCTMSKIWSFIIIVSIIFAIITGNADKVLGYITNASYNSVENIITLTGTLCFWMGIFNVVKHTNIINKIANIIMPLINKLLKKDEINDEIIENVSLNITSNALGVGNAATAYSINAINKMQELNKNKEKPNDSMTMFILLNTASIQLIPTTIISLRIMYSSQNPGIIILPVWIVSITALFMGLISIKILNKVIK